MPSFSYPNILDQIKYSTFYRLGEEICKKEETAEEPQSQEGWRRINDNDIWFHSKWAANFAKYLELLRQYGYISTWSYQPKTFELKGDRSSYTPDFKVTKNDGSHFWVETKDTGDDFDLWVKTMHFEEQHSDELLFTSDVEWFKENIEKLKKHILDWE